MRPIIAFFIGTEAELIKTFPVMLECKKAEIDYVIIASGQNDIGKSRLMDVIGRENIRIFLSDERNIHKNAAGLLSWYLSTYSKAEKIIRKEMQDIDFSHSIMVVHGDTVSTLMGAWIGKKLKMTVAHIEAGLRSHHLFNPFPEEMDRLLTSRKADIHFAPGKSPAENLNGVRGTIIDTQYNTIIDSLRYAMSLENDISDLEEKYFVFVLHRQENLLNRKLAVGIINAVLDAAQRIKCVFILHDITGIFLENNQLMDTVSANQNVILQPRMEYFDFMKLLYGAEFVLTDGGSNQEELHYMGKPCLILRTTTERQEGIGENAFLYEGQLNKINEFALNYSHYRIPEKIKEDISPSKIIADTLKDSLDNM